LKKIPNKNLQLKMG